MVIFGNLFLAFCSVLAAFSIFEEVARLGYESFTWLPLRQSLANISFVLALVALPLCALTPRLPAAVILPSALGALWLGMGGLPLGLLVAPEVAGPLSVSLFAGCVCFSFATLRIGESGGGRWWITHRGGPSFSMRRTALFAAAGVVLAPPLLAVYMAMLVTVVIEGLTGNFIDVHRGGVSILERSYVRGEKEVRLVGMMHVGERRAYDELFGSFAGGSTLVLEEGISDREGIFSTPLSHSKLGQAVGLEAQESVAHFFAEESLPRNGAKPPDVRRADIDASEFSPPTIALLERVASASSSNDVLGAMLEVILSPPTPEERAAILDEIVWIRNDVVLLAVEDNLDAYDHIVVPWGAMHMPGIERELGLLGFVAVSQSKRLLFSWSTVLSFLWAAPADGTAES